MLFEFLASDDEERRVASRKAVAVASRRCEQFFTFLDRATDEETRKLRFSMIENDLNEVIAQAADEFGVDETHLRSAIHKLPISVAVRKPKMCPYHREVVDVSLGTGEAQAGYSAMAQHAYSENSCRGSFDGRCNFKPEMVTQTYWDKKGEEADQRRLEREQQAELQPVRDVRDVRDSDDIELGDSSDSEAPFTEVSEVAEPSAIGEGVQEPMVVAAGAEHLKEFQFKPKGESEDSEDDDEETEESEEVTASTREAEALKTVKVDSGGESPSPKMDKKKWTPENVSFLDVEQDGSPHPTRHQDILEPTSYNDKSEDGRFDQTDAVLEKQDVEQGSELSHSGQGGTFPKGNQANPVTAGDARPKVAWGNPGDGHGDLEHELGPSAYQPDGQVDFQHPGYNPDDYQICQQCGNDHVSPDGKCPHCGHDPRLQTGLDDLSQQLGERLMPNIRSSIKEALTARDFVMIADAIATSPGNQQQLAEHFANYLANTNPRFDRERFIAAATGRPSTGRDTFRPPPGTDPQLTMSAVDPDKNPIREMAEFDFPSEEEVHRAIVAYHPPYGSDEHDVMFGNQPPGGEPLPNISPLDGIHDELMSRDGYHPEEPPQCESCGNYMEKDPNGYACEHCGHQHEPYVPPAAQASPHPDDIPF